MVLQYDETNPSASATQPIAHSTVPWAPVLPDFPVKRSGWTRLWPWLAGVKKSFKPSERFHRCRRLAALKDLPVQRLAPRDLDLEPLRQRIDHGDADAVQAA